MVGLKLIFNSNPTLISFIKMVRLLNDKVLSILFSHIISYPTPSNLNFFWGFGSLSGFLLIWQLISGVFLAVHYSPEVSLAFLSVEHLMRDVNSGWLLRYAHSGGASMFFICIYCHMGRNLYFRSYRKTSLWFSGLVIFLILMGTAFMGYVLPWGQMSLWAATVITNLFSAFPIVGKDIVIWLWGGFSVDNPTLKRFFIIHFILPFVLTAMSILHIILLHEYGSTNPIGICAKLDMIRFYPYFLIKDLFGFFTLIGVLSFFTVFELPNFLGHPDNYIKADFLVTPKHIVPEWYFLPFYAILRSIPNKLGGVIAMFSAILTLFLIPFIGKFTTKSSKFFKLSQFLFWSFSLNFIFLGYLGACVVEEPFVMVGQIATCFYFSYLLLIIPLLTLVEHALIDSTGQYGSALSVN